MLKTLSHRKWFLPCRILPHWIRLRLPQALLRSNQVLHPVNDETRPPSKFRQLFRSITASLLPPTSTSIFKFSGFFLVTDLISLSNVFVFFVSRMNNLSVRRSSTSLGLFLRLADFVPAGLFSDISPALHLSLPRPEEGDGSFILFS